MKVNVPHSLERAEVRRRLDEGKGDIALFVPGGMADVETNWESEDRLALVVRAMGQELHGRIDIEDTQVVFAIDLPLALSFVEPVIAGALREGGQKLLAPKPTD